MITINTNALIAGKSVDLTAQNNIDGSSEAITNVNPTGADINNLTNKIVELLVNNFLWGKLNGVINVDSLKTSFQNALGELNAVNIAKDIFYDRGFGSITNRVNNITNSAQGSLNSFNLYKAGSLLTDAKNYFTSTIMDTLEVGSAFVDILPSLYGDATAVSSFDLKQANANIYINSGARILSKDFLNINAENNEITGGIYSGAESIISNNIFGNTNAKSYTTVNSSANINIVDTSLLESSIISMSSDSDITKTGYVNTTSRGTAFDVASGNLNKDFSLNFFDSSVRSVLGTPSFTWLKDVPIIGGILNVIIGWTTETITETINIANSCSSVLGTVTKTAGINDTFNLIRYQDNAVTSIVSNQNSSAVLNGNINILGASERILTVNADGSINPASNLTPTITDKITVENTLNSSKLNISAPHGTISGTAKIKDIYYYAPVTIVNNSAKDLVINDFNMLSKGTSTRNISAQTNNLTFNVLAAETKFGDNKLNISNPFSNLTFTGQVGSPDTNFIINTRGNITGTGSTLIAKNIDLNSTIGNINNLNMYLTNHGQVNAQSGGLINIGISGINYLPATFGDYYDEQIINFNNLTAGTSLDLNINGSVAKNYLVNSQQGFIINSQTASSGLLSLNNLSAGNNINITSTKNALNVNSLISTAGNASIMSSYGSVVDTNGDLRNIKANNIGIQSTDGFIDLDIDSSGTVSIDALGLVDVTETSGNLIASLIKSGANIKVLSDGNINATSILGNDVELESTNGNIIANMNSNGTVSLDSLGLIDVTETSGNLIASLIKSQANIKVLSDGNINATSILGNDVELKSTNGNIIANMNSNGTVSLDSLGLIDVTETSGNLIASLIKSGANIKVLSDGNINATSILGNDVELKSTNGAITANMNSNGKIYGEAQNAIDIEEVSGNMNVDYVESKTSNVRLIADNSILDFNNNETANILGHDITLISNNADIGEVANYLDLKSTGKISANAQNNIYLRETNNNMNVNLIEANTGNVGLIAYNSILNARDDNANNIIGNNLTLKTLNGSIGSELKSLNIKATGMIKMNSSGSVYFKNNDGDLNLDELVSDHGSIGIHVTDGNAFIRHISAPDKIDIIVSGDTLNIETIDPTELSLKVSSENGNIKVVDGFISEKATLIADNILAKFTDTDLANPLKFTITGNDGIMANNVDLNVKTSIFQSDIFNSNKSTIASTTDSLDMKWVNVGKTMNIDSPSRSILVYNNNDYLSGSKIQLYSPNKPFSLSAYPDSLVQTNAFITNYGNSQILNHVDSENSVVKAGYKNTTKIQYLVEEELNPPDMATMAKNQRNNIRWDINTIGTIKLNNTENTNVKINTISSGGASILFEKDLPIGEELQISLLYNGLDINAKAKVVRKTFDKETGKYDFGLMFTEIDNSIAKLIPYACMSANAL